MVAGQNLIKGLVTRFKTWRLVAGLAAAALLSYYAFLGFQYWGDSRQVDSLSSQADDMARTLRRPLPDESNLSNTLDQEEGRLQALAASLQNPGTDQIVDILSQTARESGVSLGSILLGEAVKKMAGDIEYEPQPVTITLQGSSDQVYRFLSLLSEKAPMVAVANLRMSGLEGKPSVQAQLLFNYLSPATFPEGG